MILAWFCNFKVISKLAALKTCGIKMWRGDILGRPMLMTGKKPFGENSFKIDDDRSHLEKSTLWGLFSLKKILFSSTFWLVWGGGGAAMCVMYK